MPPVAVFDIDGVLADVTHRSHHLRARPTRWERFFTTADRDPLLDEGATRLRKVLAEHDVVATWLPHSRTLARAQERDGRT